MSARQWLRSLSGAAMLVAFPAMLVLLLGVLVGAEVLLVTESVGKALSRALFVDLPLMDDRRQPLSRDQFDEPIGADLITEKPDIHRDRIGSLVFGLTEQSGRERYAGLLQLLHTLRAPDMGNRIDEGNLPKILSDALPPLSETALREAGERLDALKDSREEQRRLMMAVEQVEGLSNERLWRTSGGGVGVPGGAGVGSRHDRLWMRWRSLSVRCSRGFRRCRSRMSRTLAM